MTPESGPVIATANSQTAIGVEGELVEVEARVSGREHGGTIIVGLPDRAVTEARERVRAGVIASELWWPKGRVVVNLAPGNVPKLGPRHDLAMAVAILAASDQLPRALAGKVLVLGELAFDGRLRPVHGALIAAETARRVGLEALVCPRAQPRSLCAEAWKDGDEACAVSAFLCSSSQPPDANIASAFEVIVTGCLLGCFTVTGSPAHRFGSYLVGEGRSARCHARSLGLRS